MESNFIEDAVSRTGAYGLTQITKIANIDINENLDRFNRYDNILLSILFIRKLLNRFNGDLVKALRYYNGGNSYNSEEYTYATKRYVRNVFSEQKKINEVIYSVSD